MTNHRFAGLRHRVPPAAAAGRGSAPDAGPLSYARQIRVASQEHLERGNVRRAVARTRPQHSGLCSGQRGWLRRRCQSASVCSRSCWMSARSSSGRSETGDFGDAVLFDTILPLVAWGPSRNRGTAPAEQRHTLARQAGVSYPANLRGSWWRSASASELPDGLFDVGFQVYSTAAPFPLGYPQSIKTCASSPYPMAVIAAPAGTPRPRPIDRVPATVGVCFDHSSEIVTSYKPSSAVCRSTTVIHAPRTAPWQVGSSPRETRRESLLPGTIARNAPKVLPEHLGHDGLLGSFADVFQRSQMLVQTVFELAAQQILVSKKSCRSKTDGVHFALAGSLHRQPFATFRIVLRRSGTAVFFDELAKPTAMPCAQRQQRPAPIRGHFIASSMSSSQPRFPPRCPTAPFRRRNLRPRFLRKPLALSSFVPLLRI